MNDLTPAQASAPATSIHRGGQVPGILIFILADMVVFCMLFAGFMTERMNQLALFDQSALTLDVHLGVLNTLILVTSGLCVVLAVHAAHSGRRGATRLWLLMSFLVGAGFGVTKLIEYSSKIGHGITMHTNDFYMFYYALTGALYWHMVDLLWIFIFPMLYLLAPR